MVDDIRPEDFDKKKHVKEYKRKCKQCGKVWHSLASREKEIEKSQEVANCGQGANACTCNHDASLQAQRNVDASKDTLSKLRSCPECKSGNYEEEVIIYEKKEHSS